MNMLRTGWERLRSQFSRRQLVVPLDERRLRLLWGCFCLVALGGFLATRMMPESLQLAAGQVAPRDVEAPRDFIDRPTTERLRREAADRVMPVYVHNPQVADRVDAGLASTFQRIRAVRQSGADSPQERLAALRQALALDVSDQGLTAILEAGDDVIDSMERDVRAVMRREMAKNISAADLPTFQREAVAEVRALNYPRPHADFLARLVEDRIQPNFFLDEEGTRRQRLAAMEEVAPATIVKGEVIVRKGARVTPDDLVRLRDAGVLRPRSNWGAAAGAFMLAALSVGLVALFLYLFRPRIYADVRRIVLLGVVGLGAVLLTRALWPVSPFLAPVPGAMMLLAILLDPMTALGTGVTMALVAALVTGQDLSTALVALAGGLAGVYSVSRASGRGDIVRAGFVVALVNATAILALHLTAGPIVATGAVARDVLAGMANGVLLAGVLTIGSLPYFENVFGILTSLKLLELANPNHPLLRRLLLEAPGTYHHSLLVANLAEAGAEAVGANPLLCRVGAYYHDIGKIKRPYFFVENQFGGRNPHDKLSPHLSALIVIAHVKDGIELARQYRLPEEIVRFIPEHHGTTLLAYFYQRALAAGEDELVEESFRHIGPIPQSKETAIVMLADAAEAVVRSLPRPTPGRVQAAVRRVIRERLNDGQLNQSDLTLKDLDAVAEAFVRVLGGVHHGRIEYPEPARDAPLAAGGEEPRPAAGPVGGAVR